MELILIFICIIAFIAVSAYIANIDNCLLLYTGGLLLIVGLWLAISYPFIAYNYHAAGYKAKVINGEYNTNYTQEEIFFAGDVIDEIKDLNRKRIEINGDLLRGEK